MMLQSHTLISPASGVLADEIDTWEPIRLKHILPNTLFTISLTDFTAYVLRDDRSVMDTQSFQEWASIEEFCEEVGYTLETTLDAWCGTVLNPDIASC
ncbi:hypothetical protein H6F43_03730 [Leptolyngbya sp. FACHB-36]|uniref:hypothetical protein n=1 Tax=Leptolyngbya sp. FACHB-36 TaxID=2692808 RepID=UPI001680DAB3|nr:hypothetical protein [Leptolyngbya sp. FACHB-36]MBD2019292.1 hypothetical protein [Leptolyngbya sp. FACHB-36]